MYKRTQGGAILKTGSRKIEKKEEKEQDAGKGGNASREGTDSA